MIQHAAKARTVLHDEWKSWQARVLEARQLLAELGESTTGSFVSEVRKTVADDAPRVHARLASLKDLKFGGRAGDASLDQWNTWTNLQRQGGVELEAGARLPDVGAA